MARQIGNTLPPTLHPLFAGDRIESHQGLTFLFLTTTPDGWPHLAMLSVGEVLAVGERVLRVALWRGSTASVNLAHSGRATLALVHEGAGYSIRCDARQGPDLPIENGRLAYFELSIEQVLEDVAPYAELTSGVTFRLKDPQDVLARWQGAIEAMRDCAPLGSDPSQTE
jgi:hypothetical protein